MTSGRHDIGDRHDASGTPGTRGGTVVGLFHHRNDAERAIGDLIEVGFPRDQIGIAVRDAGERERLGESTGVEAHDIGAKVGTGALVGGALGALATLLIPGLGAVAAAGTLGTILAGAGTGAGIGSLVGALTSWGMSEEEASHFEHGFSRGGTLVTVHAGVRATEARGILRNAGADLGPAHATGTAATGMHSPGVAQGSMGAGTMGAGSAEPWRGSERRYHDDPNFTGPERRRHLQNV